MNLDSIQHLPNGKKIYFASDFHLGAPDAEQSLIREKKIIRWLDSIADDAHAILFLGDIFDFWFEYKTVVPRGYVRFLGKLAELKDRGIHILLFTGNHDMWMFDFFPKELNIPVIKAQPISLQINGIKMMIGHGDGLGPGDKKYKFLKKIFANPFCQWCFERLHPNLGIGIATRWSQGSRLQNADFDEQFLGEDEWIFAYCKEIEAENHHDYYLFGHRHLPLNLKINENARYYNLGEWFKHCLYGEFDGKRLELKNFESETQLITN
ncbi:UDP-2,3-diacylglucosamine diphosphatase [Persicobacter diffluens]|uniref:UDP-2,3-diacylglucosamine hydrolase n=1 Tax=Persicobacter diffluens TaxID=981 RepID=A0AAN5AIF5_9BACT|nr:UDP-2,3-diacylglucosamine hydrolase [Persicobacter diffluens]